MSAGQQHIIGAASAHELARVLLKALLLFLNALQIFEENLVQLFHRFETTAPAMLAPAKGMRPPVRCGGGRRKQGLNPRQQGFCAYQKSAQFGRLGLFHGVS